MLEVSIEFLVGNIAGWASNTIGSPFDIVKTKLQSKEAVNLSGLNKACQQHGFSYLYRGASSMYFFSGVINALEFVIFEVTKNFFENRGIQQIYSLPLSGSFVGFVTAFIYTPAQYTKIKAQISLEEKPKGSLRMIYDILRQKRFAGIRELYKGLKWTLFRQMVGSFLYFGGYYVLILKISKQKSRQKASFYSQFIAAFIASGVSHMCLYPVDTIKTSIQGETSTLSELVRDKFWKSRNFRYGFYVAITRGLLMDTTNLLVYENCRNSLISQTH